MARRNLDWHVGWWSDGPLVVSGPQEAVLTLITASELNLYEDDLVVERVVGQYMIRTKFGALLTHIRLAVRPENEAAVFTNDLTVAGNADEQFMWHKVHYTGLLSSNMAPNAHPEWSHIDCRVNRKVEGVDRLVLCFQNLEWSVDPTTGEPDDWDLQAWIRVLVKT